MKTSSRQYYWLILSGLILGLAFAVANAFYAETINSSLSLKMVTLVTMVLAGICYCTVIWEMWDRWRLKLVAALLLLGLLIILVHPVLVIILYLGPVAYWVGSSSSNTT